MPCTRPMAWLIEIIGLPNSRHPRTLQIHEKSYPFGKSMPLLKMLKQTKLLCLKLVHCKIWWWPCGASPIDKPPYLFTWNPDDIITAWWFQTFLIFHILGRIIPTDFHIFQSCRYTTNQIIILVGWNMFKPNLVMLPSWFHSVPAAPRSNKQPAMVAAPKWSYSGWGESPSFLGSINPFTISPRQCWCFFAISPHFREQIDLLWFGCIPTVGSQSYIDLSGRLKSDSLWFGASGLSQDGTASPRSTRPRKGVLGQKCSSWRMGWYNDV